MNKTAKCLCVFALLTANVSRAAEVSCFFTSKDGKMPEVELSYLGPGGFVINKPCIDKLKAAVKEKVNVDSETLNKQAEIRAQENGQEIVDEAIKNGLDHYDASKDKNFVRYINKLDASFNEPTYFTQEVLIKKDTESCQSRELKVNFFKKDKPIFSEINLTDEHASFKTILTAYAQMPYSDKITVTGQDVDLPTTILRDQNSSGIVFSKETPMTLIDFKFNSGELPVVTLKCK